VRACRQTRSETGSAAKDARWFEHAPLQGRKASAGEPRKPTLRPKLRGQGHPGAHRPDPPRPRRKTSSRDNGASGWRITDKKVPLLLAPATSSPLIVSSYPASSLAGSSRTSSSALSLVLLVDKSAGCTFCCSLMLAGCMWLSPCGSIIGLPYSGVFPKNGLFARPEGRLGRYSPDDEDLITKFARLFPFGNVAPFWRAETFRQVPDGGEPDCLV
jgi:hypothetical protein